MKRILILILGLFGVAQAQFAPTSAKTAFKNGVSLGTRDSSAYVAADSLVMVINRQGRMMYRSTDGYWKILGNVGVNDYVPYNGANANVFLGTYRMKADAFDLGIPSTSTDSIGRLRWNADDLTMNIGLTSSVVLQTGQEMLILVKNQTGTTIPNGTVVRQSGVVGASGRLKIEPFLANGVHNSNQVLGLTTEDIADGADGFVAYFGKVNNLNTAAYPDSTILYASSTVAGALTDTVPEAPNNIVKIGTVVKSASSNGIIFTRVVSGSNINQDEGVQLTNPLNNSLLVYDSLTTLWKNKTLVEIGAVRVQDTAAMLLGYLRLTGGNLTGPLTTTVSGAGVIAGLFNANSSTSIPVKAVNSAANGNLFIGNNGTNDVFTVDGYGTIYGVGLDIGTNFSGVYSGSFGNSNVNGNGVAINAASGTNYALNIRNYNSSAELFKVLGNGNASASGTFTADSIKKLGGTSSQFLKADGSIDGTAYGTGSVTSVSAGTGMSFTTITSSGSVNADTTTLATRAYVVGLDVGKANTSLNNVNGVLSSTYGGAGSVNGILKANGSGVVSAAVAGTDYVVPGALSGYLPLTAGSGNYLTGDLFIGNNMYFSGRNTANSAAIAMIGIGSTGSGFGNKVVIDPDNNGTQIGGALGVSGALSGTSLSMSGGANLATSSGNVGIGTSSPQSKLNIVGQDIYLTGETDNRIRFSRFVFTGNNMGAAIGYIYGVANTQEQGNLAFYTNPNFNGTGSLTERMRITSGGNVLIKTTTDNGTDALQVAGSAYIKGSLTIIRSSTAESSQISNEGNLIYNARDNFNHVFQSNGTEIARISTTGAATFSSSVTAGSFVKSGGTSSQTLMADGSVQTVTSGTYTPTFTNTANVTASSLQQATYIRQGNVTTVFVCGELTPTAANTQTLLHLTLPQSTSYSLSQSYIGTGTIYDISNEANSSGNVSISSSDTTKAFIRCYPTSINPVKFSFTFQYIN